LFKEKKGNMTLKVVETVIGDYVDPDLASGVAIICPKCKKKTLNTRFCVLCAEQIHPVGWNPPLPVYGSLPGDK